MCINKKLCRGVSKGGKHKESLPTFVADFLFQSQPNWNCCSGSKAGFSTLSNHSYIYLINSFSLTDSLFGQ